MTFASSNLPYTLINIFWVQIQILGSYSMIILRQLIPTLHKNRKKSMKWCFKCTVRCLTAIFCDICWFKFTLLS